MAREVVFRYTIGKMSVGAIVENREDEEAIPVPVIWEIWLGDKVEEVREFTMDVYELTDFIAANHKAAEQIANFTVKVEYE